MSDYAVLRLYDNGIEEGDLLETRVHGWYDTEAAALKAAAAANEIAPSWVAYRAVSSSVNGIWHSLTGESLYDTAKGARATIDA